MQAAKTAIAARYETAIFNLVNLIFDKNMPAGHDWRDWHLTVRGWVPGNSKADVADKTLTVISVPPGCVLTLRYHTFLPTENSASANYYTKILRGKHGELVQELLARYGDDPEDAAR
jgi:hypothetical protein